MLFKFRGIAVDRKNIGILYFAVPVIELALLLLLLLNKDMFYFEVAKPYLVCYLFYFVIDFIVPVIMMFQVLMLFSEERKNATLSFKATLPLGRMHYFGKYLSLLVLQLVPHVLFLFVYSKIVTAGYNLDASFLSLLFLSLPTCLFLMSMALLSISVLNTLFFSAIVCGSYLLIDIGTTGTIFTNKSIFISQFIQNFKQESIFSNRVFFACLSLCFMLLAFGFLKVKAMITKSKV